ncbi:MAG TPA: cell division protein FtsW, partial [Rhodospirillales bacterium]|nr:cell division protein FtsW [Rhodospirillales bacterium]
MSTFTRTDKSLVGRWWWTIDRWTLAAVLVIAVIGALLTLAASPAVAERI